MHAIERAWYEGASWLFLLKPLESLYRTIAARRRQAYESGAKPVYRAPVPVIVVGNITVGGTGKTPMVAWLVEVLREAGYRPGVVSRGYGARAPEYPWFVTADTPTAYAGDEPVLLVQRTGCPLVVDPQRGRAVEKLLAMSDCNVVISDDGLQHYALARDVEIVVIDGVRGLGNGRCLPAGPLREPPQRLREVDLIVANGGMSVPLPRASHVMELVPDQLEPVAVGGESGTAPAGGQVHGVAGIGNPERFFAALRRLGFAVIEHPFPDHHDYKAADIGFGDGLPVVMTEKDAVKCREFATGRHWYMPVSAKLEEGFDAALISLLARAELHTRSGSGDH